MTSLPSVYTSSRSTLSLIKIVTYFLFFTFFYSCSLLFFLYTEFFYTLFCLPFIFCNNPQGIVFDATEPEVVITRNPLSWFLILKEDTSSPLFDSTCTRLVLFLSLLFINCHEPSNIYEILYKKETFEN